MAYYAEKFSTETSNVLPGGAAGVALVVGDLVYMDSNGKWQKADSVAIGSTTRKDAQGVMIQDAVVNEFVSPVKCAEIENYSGLTVGAKQYLSDTAGAVTETEPTTTIRQEVGFARAADTIRFEIGAGSGANQSGDVGGDAVVDTLTSLTTITCGTDLATTNGKVTVDVANANALAVGANGATNPALNVHTSTADAATGLQITAAAAAGGVAAAAISSGTNEDLTIDAKGSGSLTLQGTATGGVVLGDDTTVADGKNLVAATTTGTKIGTAVTQKLGFWNVTPVVQPADAAQGTVAATTTTTATTTALETDLDAVRTLVLAIRTALVNSGIIKGAA